MSLTIGTQLHVGGAISFRELCIFPLWTSGEWPVQYVTRRTAGMQLVVDELPSPSVPELSFTNHGTHPVLALEGETVSGGLQDRTLNASVLVPPAATIVAPVSCAEAHRWSPGAMNRTEGHTPPGLRSRKTRGVNVSRRRGEWLSDQDGVWADVEWLRQAHQADAPTASYHDVHDHVMRNRPHRAPRPLEGQRGVLIAMGGQVRAIEVFDRSSTFQEYWPGLFEAALAEALTVPPRPTAAPAARRAADRVRSLRLEQMSSRGLGADLHATEGDVVASGLYWQGRIVHLAGFFEAAA